MQEKLAIVFEIYRYSVCYTAVLVFGIMAFWLLTTIIGDPKATANMGSAGLGVLLSSVIYLLHRQLKNPAIS